MTTFVGRTEELGRLTSRFESAVQGTGGVLFITGEAGAGKSTLIEEFLERVAASSDDAMVIRAACSEQYGAGEPYQPFVEAFRNLLTRQDQTPQKRSFLEVAREVAPHWISAIPVAGDLIAASMATAGELRSSFQEGGAGTAASEEALFFQYTEAFFAAAAERPIVLFIDDLHWADRASVSLLSHIARKIGTQRVFILGSYRPVDVDVSKHPIREAKLELERYRVAEELVLRPLDDDALGDFIRLRLGGPPAPDLLEWLAQRAGTNALFFEELLKWLVDQGIATEHRGEWRLARRPQEIEIPRSAESTIERRLGRLEPEVYKVLEYASVSGNEFDSTTLSRLLDADELELEEQIEPLVRVHQVVRMTDTRDLPNGDITSVYEFSHSLFQDVLQKNLQGKRRILLNRKMAEILEEIFGAETESVVHKLAVHYDEGRLKDRAYECSLRAAERASRLYAHWDAIELIRRAERNATDEGQKADVLARLGRSNWLVGRYPEALESFSEALGLATATGDAPAALAIKRSVVLVEKDQGTRPAPEILSRMDELAEEARRLGAAAELCHILWHSIELPGTDEARDVELAREALEAAGTLDDEVLLANAHLALGSALTFHDDPAGALEHLEEAVRLSEAAGDLRRAGRSRNSLAIANVLLGNYVEASLNFNAAASAMAKAGEPLIAAIVRANLGALLIRIGDWDAAERSLLEARRRFEQIEASARLPLALQNLAELAEIRGDLDGAMSRWEELLELGVRLGYWTDQVIAHCGIGTVRLERGDLEGARASEVAAQASLADQDSWTEAREAFQLFTARLAAASGEIDGAVALLEAAETALESRDRYVRATFRLYRGEILAKRDPAAAKALIEDAARTFEGFGAEPMRKRAVSLLTETTGEPWATSA